MYETYVINSGLKQFKFLIFLNSKEDLSSNLVWPLGHYSCNLSWARIAWRMVWYGLLCFYGISIIVGYLMSNMVYTYIRYT